MSIAGGFLQDALKKFEQQVSQQVSQPAAQTGVPTGVPTGTQVAAELVQGALSQLPTGTQVAAESTPPPLPTVAAEQPAELVQGALSQLPTGTQVAAESTPPPSPTVAAELAEQPAELGAAELEVSQLSDDLLYHMLESISDSTDSALLPKVLSNTQKNISDDDNYLLSFKQYTNAEQYTDYTIYYKDYDALNTGTNFLDKSFNYFVYSPDGTNVEITPIKKYYTLNDILKQICNLFDNIIIISKNISSSPISVLYQYKDYKHKSLIFIYNSTYNDILKNIREFIDIIPENTRTDNPITIVEYNSIKTEIYKEQL